MNNQSAIAAGARTFLSAARLDSLQATVVFGAGERLGVCADKNVRTPMLPANSLRVHNASLLFAIGNWLSAISAAAVPRSALRPSPVCIAHPLPKS